MKRSVRSPVLTALATTLVVTATATAVLNRPDPTDLHSTPTAAAGKARPAIEEFHPVVREDAAHDAGYASPYTVYRPAELPARATEKLPVVVFGNGACRPSANPYIGAHTLLAAHGFLVVAVGAYDQSDRDEDGTAHPEVLRSGITWAQKENKRPGSPLRGRIDTGRVAVAGTSCGGIEALVAGADPRVDTVVSFNSGFQADASLGYGREELENLHTPTLYVDGGVDDKAYENSRVSYDLSDVPAVRASNAHAGHSGFWRGLRDGEPDGTIHEEAVAVLVQWLDFTLNGNRTARNYFLGEDCGLCAVEGWDVTSKGFGKDPAKAKNSGKAKDPGKGKNSGKDENSGNEVNR